MNNMIQHASSGQQPTNTGQLQATACTPSNHELDCFHEQHGQHWLRIAVLQRKPDNLAQSMQILQAVQGVKLRMREIGVFAKEVRELLQAVEASADGVVDPFGDIILLSGFVFRSKVLANKIARSSHCCSHGDTKPEPILPTLNISA